jgi:hypothetical protein
MLRELAGPRESRSGRAIAASAAAGLALSAVVALAFWNWQRDAEEPAPVAAELRAPPSGPGAAAGRRALSAPMYKQWDPAWGDDLLGPTRDPMRFTGCTVCCVAMAFSAQGRPTTPKELNDWLKAHGGYTRQGLLKWEKCEEFSGGAFALDYHGPAERARLDAALAAGRPAIVKVLLEGGVAHWVLVIGTEDGEYLVNDPLNGSREPARLSAYGRYLHALRVFRKAR